MKSLRIAVLLCACALPLHASAAPRPFTIAEEAIIDRNEALRSIYETDPALVRRVLNALKSRWPKQGQAA